MAQQPQRPSYQANMPLTYEEFLAMSGKSPQQKPQQTQTPKQQSPTELVDALLSGGKSEAASESALGSSALGSGAGLTSSTGASTTFASGTAYAGEAVGTAANGGTLMSTGAIVPVAEGAPMASGGASAAAGAGAEAAGAFDLAGIGGAGNVILPAVGALGAYDLYKNQMKTGNKKRGAVQGAASGAAMGSYFGPYGAVAGGVAGGIYGATSHESTRDASKRKTQSLLKKNPQDAQYQNFVAGMRQQYDSAPPDPSKPFAGKYATFDEYKKAGLEAGDLTGVRGNLQLGSDYTNLNFDQQKAVTQKIIDAGLYNSKKGEVEISDQARAKQILAEVAANGYKPSQPKQIVDNGAVGRPVSGSPTPSFIPRSKTRSPGIGLDGKPIKLWSK